MVVKLAIAAINAGTGHRGPRAQIHGSTRWIHWANISMTASSKPEYSVNDQDTAQTRSGRQRGQQVAGDGAVVAEHP